MNYFDLFVGTPSTREYYGKALRGVRDKVYLAGHLGCADLDGQYVKTRDEALCKDFLEQFYEKLDTDCAESCLHCRACTKRCPFGIDAEGNMRRAQGIFGF